MPGNEIENYEKFILYTLNDTPWGQTEHVRVLYTYSKQKKYNFASFGASKKFLCQNGVEFRDKFIKILKRDKTQELRTLYVL